MSTNSGIGSSHPLAFAMLSARREAKVKFHTASGSLLQTRHCNS